MLKKALSSLVLLTAVLCITTLTEGSMVTWRLMAEVNSVDTPLVDYFSSGDIVEYVFSFDTTTADSNPDTVRGQYFDSISQAQISVGSSYHGSIENYGIEVFNDYTREGTILYDMVSFHLASGNTVFNVPNLIGSDGRVYEFIGINGHFKDIHAGMFASDSLPDTFDRIITNSDEITFIVS